MGRIKIPETFAGQQALLKKILAQNTALGTKSPLPPFLKKQNIDIAKLQSALTGSAEQDTASGNLKKESETDTQHRNLAMETPWTNLLGEVQFLKHFYAGVERELGEWGITIDAQNRVAYPTGVVAEAELIQTFIGHHKSFAPGESPLQWYLDEHEIDVDADLQAAADVLDIEDERNTTTGDSELATQMRDKLWASALKAIHLIGAYLMHLYREDSRKMAAWGFEVVEDAAGTRAQNSKVDPLETKIQKSVVIPSVFENTGEDELYLWKGGKKEGESTVVKPGEQLGMTKGYSTITVYNPSSLVMGEYLVVVHV